MDKSTESLSDSDSNVSTSWVFVEEAVITESSGSNQFYLNCLREPIQELTENDLGTVTSDIDSDTDGISVISESEENQIKETALEESSDDGNSTLSNRSSDIEVIKDEPVEAINHVMLQQNDEKPIGINFKRFLSTSSIVGSSLVIFAILLAPYMSTEKEIEDMPAVNDNYDYFYDNKQNVLIYHGNKIETDSISNDYSIKKTNKDKVLQTTRAHCGNNKNVNGDCNTANFINEQKHKSTVLPHHTKDKYDKEFKTKKMKYKDKKDKHFKEANSKKIKHINRKHEFNGKKHKKETLDDFNEIMESFHKKIINDIKKSLEREKYLKAREEYLLKKEKYLIKKEKNLHRTLLKLAKNNPQELCRKLKNTLESNYPLHEKYEQDVNQKIFMKKTVFLPHKNNAINDSLNGEWYYNLYKGRNDIRRKEHSSEWFFERATMRSRKRDKAHWYFHWMSDRAQLRFKRYNRPHYS